MRTIKFLVGTTALVSSIGACKWTDFDDLEKDSWISVTSKPNGDSTDYGVALQRGSLASTANSGGKLVALGAGQAQFTEIVYTSTGDADLAPTALKLNNQFGVGNLDPLPLLLADPASDEIALVTNAGGQSIAVLSGVGGLIARQVFGPEQPDAAAYMMAPARLDPPGAAVRPATPIVAAGDSVYGVFDVSQPKCQLLDDTGMPMLIRGLGGASITSTTTDDLVVWGTVGSVGKLLLYPGGVFNGQEPIGPCVGAATMATSPPLATSLAADTNFAPGKGSQIIMIAKRYALLVGRKDNEGYLALYDVSTMMAGQRVATRLGTPITLPDLRTAAVLDTGAAKYVVAGYPGATIEAVKSGKVLVFPLDLSTGIDSTPAMTLHDAQPESEQAFGRAVAVTPYNGTNVIAVGADNEVFLYFRTTLYDDTRQ